MIKRKTLKVPHEYQVMFSKLLMQQIDVNVNDGSLWVQIVLAIGTWALVIISAYYMKKSADQVVESNKINRDANELAKVELKVRLRPELEFLGTRPILDTHGSSYDMRVVGTLKNAGTVPATNIIAIFAQTTKSYLRDIVWQKEREAIFTKSVSFATLPPGSENEFMFRMDWSADTNTSTLAVWLECDYEDIAKEKSEKLILCHVTGGGTVKIEQFLKSEIVEVRKRVESVQFAHEL